VLADGLLDTDTLDSLLQVSRPARHLSSDVMLTDTGGGGGAGIPRAGDFVTAAVDLDASFDSVQMELAEVQNQQQPMLASGYCDNDGVDDADFLFDDADWSSVQVSS